MQQELHLADLEHMWGTEECIPSEEDPSQRPLKTASSMKLRNSYLFIFSWGTQGGTKEEKRTRRRQLKKKKHKKSTAEQYYDLN